MLDKFIGIIKGNSNVRNYDSGISFGSTDYELGFRNAPEIDNIDQIEIEHGRPLVYRYKHWRKSLGRKRITVYGYRNQRKWILDFVKGNQVRIVPKTQQEDLTSKLSEKLKVETSDISFWD